MEYLDIMGFRDGGKTYDNNGRRSRSEVFYKSFPEEFCQIHKKASISEFLLINLLAYNLQLYQLTLLLP